MRPSEIAKRITGFSTPFGGVSWTAPEAEVVTVRRIIRYLEDRRVLYNPTELEDVAHCVTSVVRIRAFLTDEIGQLPDGELVHRLATMRAACRKFLDNVPFADGRHLRGGFEEWIFITALGELRGVIGILVAELAVAYDLPVEPSLASIFPSAPDLRDEAAGPTFPN